MRPFGPEPLTSSSGTPSSRANLRTEGDACGKCKVAGAPGSWAGSAAAAGAAGAATAATAATGVATAAAAGDAAGAAALPSRIASRSPMLTLSPTLTFISLSTPAADEGISIDALSDSTVISDCSTRIASPGLTMTSITATSLKSPMSGTRISIGPLTAAGAAATGAGVAVAAATGAAAGAAVAAACATSSVMISEPCLTLSPSFTRNSFTTPAWLDGISIEALSDSTVIRLCSALTVSPALTITSITATSSKSPMSGTVTSTNAIFLSPAEPPGVAASAADRGSELDRAFQPGLGFALRLRRTAG